MSASMGSKAPSVPRAVPLTDDQSLLGPSSGSLMIPLLLNEQGKEREFRKRGGDGEAGGEGVLSLELPNPSTLGPPPPPPPPLLLPCRSEISTLVHNAERLTLCSP